VTIMTSEHVCTDMPRRCLPILGGSCSSGLARLGSLDVDAAKEGRDPNERLIKCPH